jgi:hypothetical protein
MPAGCCGRRHAVLFVFALALAAPASLHAQPWALPRGEGSVSLIYQHSYVRDHLFSGGLRRDVGHIRTQGVAMQIDYGLTGRLSLGASLPYMAARFVGQRGHVHADGTTLDDGTYHGGLQDVRLDARYSVLELPVAVTPFVGVNWPSHDYEFFAHSAIGVRLREAQVGVHVGGVRAPFYVQGRYAFGLSERLGGRRRRRSNVDTELGWFVKPKLRLFAFELGQISHGGIEIRPGLAGLTGDDILNHDRFGRANILDVGGGVGVALARSMDLTCGALRTVAGENVHAARYAFSVGASWSFGGPSGASHHSAAGR